MKTKLLLLLITIILTSCKGNCDREYNLKIPNEGNSRIHLVEETIINQSDYSIVIVDSIEYLCQYNGGIIRITK